MSSTEEEGLTAARMALESAIAVGNAELLPALRIVTQVSTLLASSAIYDEETANYDSDQLRGVIGQLAECIQIMAAVAPQAAVGGGPPLVKRARALCAELMTVQIDGNLHQYADYLRGLQHEARSILTGESVTELMT